jgi:tetratricopeptide (TPR) repeat protein
MGKLLNKSPIRKWLWPGLGVIFILLIFAQGTLMDYYRWNILNVQRLRWEMGGVVYEQGVREQLESLSKEKFYPADQQLIWLKIREGDLNSALELLEETPGPDPLLWYQLGLGYWLKMDAVNAQKAWTKYLNEQPDSFYDLLWSRMTSDEGPKGQFADVFCPLAVHTIGVKPSYMQAYLLAGSVCGAPGGEQWLLQAVDLFSFSDRPWLELAEYKLRGGDTSEAIPLIEKALEINDENPRIDAVMALALEQLDRGVKALEWYASAVEKAPEDSRYRDLLEQACSRFGPAEVCDD